MRPPQPSAEDGTGFFGEGGFGKGYGGKGGAGFYGPWPIATGKPDWAYKGGKRGGRRDSHGGMYVPGGYVINGEFYESTPKPCVRARLYHSRTSITFQQLSVTHMILQGMGRDRLATKITWFSVIRCET